MSEIPKYPDFSEITIELRPILHPLFKQLDSSISEFSFANIYLFRKTHNYRVTQLEDGLIVIAGKDKKPFFMVPFGIPEEEMLKELFQKFSSMKAATAEQAHNLSLEYIVEEDRDNFDYLYSRDELSKLSGRKYHKKKNLVNFFTGTYTYVGKPLLDEYIKDALFVLEQWRAGQADEGDYEAAKEALERSNELQLCGGIYYVEDGPAAFALGEELEPHTFVLHFEKGIGDYKGLLQFVNQSFASILPEKYQIINREQDLGDEGLRKSKLSYKPSGFVKKYRIYPKSSSEK